MYSLIIKQFTKDYGFEHITSSPRYPQSNGEVESAVQTLKAILNKTNDEYLGLLSYRNTPSLIGHTHLHNRVNSPFPGGWRGIISLVVSCTISRRGIHSCSIYHLRKQGEVAAWGERGCSTPNVPHNPVPQVGSQHLRSSLSKTISCQSADCQLLAIPMGIGF